jgi:nucleoside-diphosphate-sugar epimerase
MEEKTKIFISGCNGFIGGYLSKELLKDSDYEIHGLTQEANAKTEGVIPHKGNLMDFEGIDKILKEVNPEFIIHLAARTEVEKSFYDPIDFSAVNYVGTINLIEKAKDLKNLKLFVFSSTMETYGEVYSKEQVLKYPKSLMAFDEETEQRPNAPYAVAKLGCEYYLKYASRAYNFPFVALRQTNTYGRWDNDFFVVEQMITRMLARKNEVNFGYKEPWRNLLYIEDLIDLYKTILNKWDDARDNFFCIGPDNALRMEDLAKMIAEKLDWKGKINWDKKPARVGEIYYLNSDNFLIEKILGWKPKTTLSEGLDKTIKIWKNNLNI